MASHCDRITGQRVNSTDIGTLTNVTKCTTVLMIYMLASQCWVHAAATRLTGLPLYLYMPDPMW